ncbi:MAG: UDP-N-acetylglucosamine 2-epimerase (non-hydrolyzing) [Cyclobacteriaceae bacterium]|nr:UDP-N-acetylglucosamine 2-epimerase (non-hydrolyzing) [Cyclobacteriaceae bacterium]
MLIDIIAGARPNFMKIAPVIAAIRSAKNEGSPIDYRLIHTGQHYDKAMSDNFFIQLGIPHPDINLGVGSGSQAQQTAGIMVKYEEVLLKKKPDICLVVGDVTSTMACAIAAKKMLVKVAHVEGGIRSGDITMPEEINRMVTDSITDFFFTTSETANKNLRKEGKKEDNIFFVGNTMIDTLLSNMDRIFPPEIWKEAALSKGNYFTLTLHRPSNVDDVEKLSAMIREVMNGARGLPVIFPVHPRTRKNMGEIGHEYKNLHLVPPMSYLEFIYLVKHTRAVITDSGGITEEATVMGIPCMTLRDSTERPETVDIGTNELLGSDLNSLRNAFERLFTTGWKKGSIPLLWDGHTSQRIVKQLLQIEK